MEKVKFGIVGTGGMGRSHLFNMQSLPNATVTAVCDINPAAFDLIQPEIRKNLTTYTDLEKFLTEADIDAVLVVVPHYFHPEVAIAAMRHNKHVIVEKPIAVHKLAAMELLEESEKHPHLVRAVMLNQRTLSHYKKIKQLIDEGELGTIHRVNWTVTDWFRAQSYYDSGDWRASWRGEGGGVLLNQCPHQLDLMQWFFGLPTKVRASVRLGKYHDIEVEDEVNAFLEYADGKTANFITTTGEMPGTNRLEIVGERGKLVYENNIMTFTRNEVETTKHIQTTEFGFRPADNWTCTINYPPVSGNQHMNIVSNVADAILKGTPLISPLADGIRSLELGNAMLLSGLEDETITLPMDEQRYAKKLAELVATSRYKKKTVQAANDDISSSFKQ